MPKSRIKAQVHKFGGQKPQEEEEPFQEVKDFNNFEKFKSDPAYFEHLNQMKAKILDRMQMDPVELLLQDSTKIRKQPKKVDVPKENLNLQDLFNQLRVTTKNHQDSKPN